ncbi:hypothetical protein BaRGS_00017156 [Batillaria attramentaria]|uniref:Uncharacterized protein n=1 Tax=Batillaria attramentaria TaxID=370345 RepID=A0ABD0KXL7_9CAEN
MKPTANGSTDVNKPTPEGSTDVMKMTPEMSIGVTEPTGSSDNRNQTTESSTDCRAADHRVRHRYHDADTKRAVQMTQSRRRKPL